MGVFSRVQLGRDTKLLSRFGDTLTRLSDGLEFDGVVERDVEFSETESLLPVRVTLLTVAASLSAVVVRGAVIVDSEGKQYTVSDLIESDGGVIKRLLV